MINKIDLSTRVDKFFPTKSANSLKREGIYTLEDLLRLRYHELTDLPGIGDKTILKIKEIKNKFMGKVTKD